MPLTDFELLSICEQEITRSRAAYDDVRAEQDSAIRQYYLRPNGKEREGYSSSQTSETRDAIEQMLPIVVDMFIQPESPVVFRPRSANDLAQAQQETALVNHVIYTQNDGAMLFVRWFKEALLLKNGYVKVFWDEKVNDRIEKYKGLTLEEYQRTLAELDERDEVIKVKERFDKKTLEPLYDCEIRVVNGDPQVKLMVCPSSRVLVTPEHNEVSLANARWCCHYELRTKSDLIVDGYSKSLVEDIPAMTAEDMDKLSERYIADASGVYGTANGDVSRDLVVVYEHYLRADRNGDGKAELLQVIIAGSATNGKVLSVQEVDFVPLIAVTPFVQPHEHYGLALADFTRSFQDTNTHILRQMLDNINLTNNPMLYVNTSAVKNPEALAKARLGGLLMGTQDAMPVTPVTVPFTAAQSFQVLQELNVRMERSTGLSEAATGLNAEVLSHSTNLVGAMTLNQAQLRARMVATTFAESGVKELVLRVRELVMKHMDGEEVVQVSGQDVPVAPRSWIRNRAAMVRIGLGSVQKAERVGVLQNLIALQEKVFAAQGTLDGPLLNHQNVYNALSEVAVLTGVQGQDRYFSNPQPFLEAKAMQPDEPQPIDTALELEAAKVTAKTQKDAADIELEREKIDLMRRELDLKERELALRATQRTSSVKEKFGVQ